MLKTIQKLLKVHPCVPIIRLEGSIQSSSRNAGINFHKANRMLEQGFSYKNALGVGIVINSPGGSAAQSYLIAQRMIQLSQAKKKPIFVFVEDVAASGGYMISLGANEIYCNPYSIIGSIGVISSSFGLVDLISKLGIEYRLETAGSRKASFNDPFKPQTEDEKQRLRKVLDSIHEKFKAFVKERRAGKLKLNDEQYLFEGDFWVGEKAVELGLVDGIGSYHEILKNKFGKDIYLPVITRDSPFLNLLGVSTFMEKMDEKSLWQKYGL